MAGFAAVCLCLKEELGGRANDCLTSCAADNDMKAKSAITAVATTLAIKLAMLIVRLLSNKQLSHFSRLASHPRAAIYRPQPSFGVPSPGRSGKNSRHRSSLPVERGGW